MAVTIEHPYYPIIFVRGYAGNSDAVEETVATPYMGFDAGSTKLRQLWTGDVTRFYFESTLVRLMKDHDYRDVYSGGSEMPIDLDIGPRSIFIYRYYDQLSTQLGTGEHRDVEQFAQGLSDLILRMRDRICGEDAAAKKAFRVYLVAHSMGGLICRCFLQNAACGTDETRGLVDKVFTYSTPHNGIDMKIVGNVPGFFSINDVNNFNRERMRGYLALPNDGSDDVDSLNGKFDPDRFFCLVGTNDRDYTVADGWSRRMVGPMSDGLVRIVNATVSGSDANNQPKHCPRAFIHRSHSGHYGIVNSEEGYQNLTRFLFGDVRVDGKLEVIELTLPAKIQEALDAGRTVRASYHFEVIVRVRGTTWDLHRRTIMENSAIFRTFDEMLRPDQGGPRHPHLFSTFLSAGARVNPRRKSLGFCLDLAIRVPEYEVEKKLRLDDHYEGGYLYREKVNFEAIPPAGDQPWKLKYGFDSQTPNETKYIANGVAQDSGMRFEIPIEQKTRPGIVARLILQATPWNRLAHP